MTPDEIPDAALEAFLDCKHGKSWRAASSRTKAIIRQEANQELSAALPHLVAERDAQNCDALIAILSAHAEEWRSRGEKSAAVGVETAIDKVRAFYINAALEKPHG